jgi:colanic acid biosynthesis glycosyl transferase WcaI
MNILFLSHYFPPEVNAPATRTYEHCKRWAASGNNVIVVTCAPNCPDGIVYNGYKNRFKRELVDGIKIIRVWTYLAPNKGFIKRIINYLSFFASAVFHCFSMRNIDVVIATSPQFFCGWGGVVLKWIRKWPFILEIRDIWPESITTVGAMKKSKIITFLEVLEKKMYHSSDHIVTVGEGYRQKIIEKGISPDKISVILNGVDTERFSLISDASFTKKKYNGENKFVCSYIGTVGMAHGLEVMLAAARKNRENGIADIVFWIVGDGAKRDELEECAKKDNLKQVVFTGRLPKEDMPAIIAASDCCLVHLRGSELFGTVIPSKIFELMAMNIPIIMAVKGEAQEIVVKGGAGVIMEPDNPESLLDCIEQIRNRGKEYFKGREYVSSLYNRDNLAKNMIEIIQNVVSHAYLGH